VHPFTITRAADPGRAITAHGADRAVAFIAGGTDLLGLIKDRTALPDHLLDINALPDMAAIDVRSDGSLRVGALARMSDLAAHPAVRQHYPVVSESLLFAASGQLRNMASIGGNIMQRTRRSPV
jgi:xanthine dehydrogenase YagS FAD-binding subunit